VDDLLTVRVGRRLMVVPAPGVAALGERAAPIRRESAALRLAEAGEIAGAAVTAPMQGTIVHVAVSDGQAIARGELVAVLEAMKMENRVLAHRDGIVGGIETAAGASLSAGAVICRIDDAPDPAP
jgi:acetyl-CoA/propionyl-CoA carboxylase biotin carboxyl carrier protein